MKYCEVFGVLWGAWTIVACWSIMKYYGVYGLLVCMEYCGVTKEDCGVHKVLLVVWSTVK